MLLTENRSRQPEDIFLIKIVAVLSIARVTLLQVVVWYKSEEV